MKGQIQRISRIENEVSYTRKKGDLPKSASPLISETFCYFFFTEYENIEFRTEKHNVHT